MNPVPLAGKQDARSDPAFLSDVPPAKYNLLHGGVSALTEEELSNLGLSSISTSHCFDYPNYLGSKALREQIGDLHGARPENILVTHGCSEANYLVLRELVTRFDEVAIMLPTYPQHWGLSELAPFTPRAFYLVDEQGAWELDLGSLKSVISSRTKVIAVTSPNNPCGHVLSAREIDALVEAAASCDAWLMVDEIYRGTSKDGRLHPSLWGRYPKTIVTGGLSKSYRAPGLRIGWIIGPQQAIRRFASRRDLTTMLPAAPSQALATLVLSEPIRSEILEQSHRIIECNVALAEKWVRKSGVFRYTTFEAGPFIFPRLLLPIGGKRFASLLAEHASVLVSPGDCYGMPSYIRIGCGGNSQELSEALAEMISFFDSTEMEEFRGSSKNAHLKYVRLPVSK